MSAPETLAENDGQPRRDTMCYEGGIKEFVTYLQKAAAI